MNYKSTANRPDNKTDTKLEKDRMESEGGGVARNVRSVPQMTQEDWDKIRSKLTQQWAKIASEDFPMVKGDLREFAQSIQEAYRYLKEEGWADILIPAKKKTGENPGLSTSGMTAKDAQTQLDADQASNQSRAV